ncbi:putative protein kinase-like domain superfamily, phosphatidylinositol kinase [Plasmopara halstedii]
MGVMKMEETETSVATMKDLICLHIHDESGDENHSEGWGADECDWRSSSLSEPPSRFSIVELPAKVRDSVFRKANKPQKKTKERSSTMDTTRTSSADSTPRDSVLLTKTRQELEQVEIFRRFWDEKLHIAMERLAGSQPKHSEASDEVFYLLLKLYAHQDVIQELYSTYDANAIEFEFYIPQLCTFLLHGNYPKQHQLECFLMSRSGESLPFAHRLTWFLRSFCNDAKEYHSEYLSLTASAGHEMSDLLYAIGMRAGVPALLMNRGLCVQEVSAVTPQNLQQRKSIIFPTDTDLEASILETDEAFAGHLLGKRNKLQHEARLYEGNTQQKQLFQQTPKFVEALTDLADQLIPTPRAQRNDQLRRGLMDIEAQMLPSDVIYLPIGNSYHRVKGIRIEECFTFSTKERVPYFLCVEVLDYSVSSSTTISKSLRKRRKSKVSLNQSRVYSLQLPLKHTNLVPKFSEDNSPVSSSTYTESEPSPTSINDMNQGQDVATPTGNEGNGDEKGNQRSMMGLNESEQCPIDGEDQQWKLPQSYRQLRRHTLSASIPFGEKVVHSSLCSDMTKQEADDELNGLQMQHMKNNATFCSEVEMYGRPTDNTVSLEVPESVISHSKTESEKECTKTGRSKPEIADNFVSPVKKGRRFSIFSKKTADVSAPAPVAVNISVSGKEKSKQNRPMVAAIFANKLQEKVEVSANAATLVKPSPEVICNAADKTKRGNKMALEFMEKDVATSAFSQKPNEGRISVVLEAEEGDAEDTDSNGCIFSDEESYALEPEPSPARQPAASFVSMFFRKPTAASIDSESEYATTRAEDATSSPQSVCAREIETCERRVSDISVRDSVSVQKLRRDLSVSLDFEDPLVWRERFDLEDDSSNGDPESELTDCDALVDEENGEIHQLGESKTPKVVFREYWQDKEARIRRDSPFGDHPGWRLLSVIVKSNDDLRQEQFAAQLIAQCDRIFREYSLPLSLRPYNVIATSAKTGLIEAVPDTVSLDSLKRNDSRYTSLLDFYIRLHGDKDSRRFARAQQNFVESLAAYSIVCYVFQIKDRHNGNILVDADGHVIHIDFGFLLTNSPGSNWNFERAPFKLTDEFVELMGGPSSVTFRYFRSLCIRAYLALRRNMDQLVLLVEMMLVGNADLPCFAGGKKAVIEGLRMRLKPGARTSACQVFVNQLIDQSINNWRTRWYDKYQRACLGIL